jgi:sec-independent protein translocase protein TatB
MLDLSWSHILLVLIVALVVVGPKDLPRLMRMAGRWVAKGRAMADQFRKSFEEMARQSELDELRAELDALRRERPLADLDHTLSTPVLPPPGVTAEPVASAAGEDERRGPEAVSDAADPGPRA